MMMLAMSMMVTSFGVTSTPAEAKSKVRLSCSKITIKMEKSKTLKLNGTKKKVKWKVVSGKKNIKLTKKKKNSVKVVGLLSGKAKVQAKVGKKKYTCKVVVKKKYAKSRMEKGTKVVTVDNLDTATLKKVHESLYTGKAVILKVKGTGKAGKTMFNKLSAAVAKYNKTGVVIQKKYCQQVDTSDGYREYRIDSEENSEYMYGVKIVDKLERDLRQMWEQDYQDRLKRVADYENEKRKEYKEGTWEYKQLFKQVTGIDYDKETSTGDFTYTDAQKPKSKTLKTCTEYGYSSDTQKAEYSEDYDLPADWYYYTYTDNEGKLQYGVDVPTLLYMQYEGTVAEHGDYENYTVNSTIGDKLLKDVTFHYEPYTIPQEQWDKISSTIEEKAKAYAIENEGKDAYAPKSTDQLLMHYNMGDLPLSSRFSNIMSGVLVMYTEYAKYDRKKEQSPGGGLTGLKEVWRDKWWGNCGDYIKLHKTLCELIGIPSSNYKQFICTNPECNHGWSGVKITNTRGETGWVYLSNDNVGSVVKDYHQLNCKHMRGTIENGKRWTSDEFFTTNEGLR